MPCRNQNATAAKPGLYQDHAAARTRSRPGPAGVRGATGAEARKECMSKSTIALQDQPAAAGAPAAVSVRWVLASLSLSMLLSSLGTSIANVGLPTFAVVFHASFQQVQWVVLAYLLAITTLIVSVGRLGDITGRRRLLLAGIFLFTAASVLCGLAPTLGLLIAARAAQGLGAAIMMALTMAFVGETVPKARTGSAMGLLGTMSAIGTALGPSLGGVLIATLGWLDDLPRQPAAGHPDFPARLSLPAPLSPGA